MLHGLLRLFSSTKTEEALESVGFNALVGRAPVPGDGEKWERAVKALDLT